MKFKTALIGLGRMGAEPSDRLKGILPNGWLPFSHAEAIKSVSQLDLVALSDIDQYKLKRFSELYRVNRVYSNYKELLSIEKPAVLSVATRTEGRVEIIEYASNCDLKAVFVEKPISRNIESCVRLINNLVQKKILIAYGATRRYMDIYKHAKEICYGGEVGELIEVIIEFGRTSLLWSHPHSVDLMLFFANTINVDFVQATCSFQNSDYKLSSTSLDDDPFVENAYVKFKNGISGSINKTSGANVKLVCSKGVVTVYSDGLYIEIRKPNLAKKTFYNNQISKINSQETRSGTVQIFSAMVNSLQDDSELPIKPKEIITGQKILFGFLFSSLQGGERLSLEEIDESFTITGRSGAFYA